MENNTWSIHNTELLWDEDPMKFILLPFPTWLPWWLSDKESACQCKRWVQSLVWEDLLEKGRATHCSILAWESPWREEPGGLQSKGSQRVRHNLATKRGYTPYIQIHSDNLSSKSMHMQERKEAQCYYSSPLFLHLRDFETKPHGDWGKARHWLRLGKETREEN